MKVTLRPLAKDAWSGVVKYKNCYEDISTYFTRSGTNYTGLTEDTAERLGKKLGLDLSQGSEFWNSFYIRTSGKDIILDLEEPMDELRYLFCKNHKRVKTSMFEHKATANFVLVNKEEESKRTNLHNRVKRQASSEFDKMSSEERMKALRLFGKSSENVSLEVIENTLYNLVEGDPQGFLDKWVNNKSRETQYILERAVSMNIIRKNKRIYSYGSDVIGHGVEDVINYLNDPKNQDVKVAVMQAIEGKGPLDLTPINKPSPVIKADSKGKHDISLTPVSEVKDAIKND